MQQISGQKARNYTAILSDKNDGSLWSICTAEQFMSSILTSAGSGLMHKVSTGPKQIRLPACVIDAVSYKGSKLTY